VIATENINYYAVFEANEVCLISPLIDEMTVLNKECRPYHMNTDVWIMEEAVLLIEPGMEIHIAEGANFIVNGAIIADGNLENGIVF